MKQIPVDAARLGTLMCVVPPEPRINQETGQVRTDQDGVTIFVVGVSVRQQATRRADVIDVAVTGEPTGITEGARITVSDLIAMHWEIGGRSGVSFRASAILPASPPPPPSPSARPKSEGERA
ncbi:hypothetical protein [Streptomyces sp. NPDC051561]|uniref:SCO3933 family regulatory protein n=1 Tax=Streptomyces sp. NPDC051561 TaxID=3365658 RepID=UPI0037B7A88A